MRDARQSFQVVVIELGRGDRGATRKVGVAVDLGELPDGVVREIDPLGQHVADAGRALLRNAGHASEQVVLVFVGELRESKHARGQLGAQPAAVERGCEHDVRHFRRVQVVHRDLPLGVVVTEREAGTPVDHARDSTNFGGIQKGRESFQGMITSENDARPEWH